ncbi:MAG: hypothetical protein JO353_12945, partial [Phycisphaerae bacterium]|nr:hypothetical protein [Phycisphaerae bacterium]
VCRLCIDDLKTSERKKIKIIKNDSTKERDKRSAMVGIVLLIILMILMAISAWRMMHHQI